MGSILTMEQGAILHQQPLLGSDYLTTDHDCIESFQGPPHHSSYTNGGAVDPIRRDGGLPHPTFALTATKNAHGAQFLPNASDGNSYRTGNNFSDSSGGSISASPSSGVSSLAYNSLPQNHYASLPAFSSAVTLPQASLVPTFHGYRSSVLDGATSVMLPPPNPMRSPISHTTHAGDRESYAHTTPLLARTQLLPNGYTSYSDTPRSVLSTSTLFSPASGPYAAHMASSSSQNYQNPQSDCANFPWPNLEVFLELTCEGQGVTPEVHAKVEKGFFLAPIDHKWTCYRRNYFSVNASYEIHPNFTNSRLYLKRNGSSELVQAMGIRLSAAVVGSTGKTIDLIQHTPKRDNGPKNKIEVIPVSPVPATGRHEHTISSQGGFQMPLPSFHPTGTVPGPYLPLQNSTSPTASSSPNNQTSQLSGAYSYAAPGSVQMPSQTTSHTFERVQFKQATANNGKRRASQQYFHLILELCVDVRKDGANDPVWVKVAHRSSDKIVVRGRSPSHYQNEGQNNQGGRGGSTNGGGSYNASGGASYTSLNPGGFRSSAGGFSSMGASGGYGGSRHYGLQPSSGENSTSSPESVEGGAMDSEHPMDAVMSDADRAGIQDCDGYSYHPAAIYETIPNQLPLPKIETNPRYPTTEPRHYAAVRTEYPDAVPGPQWHTESYGRFQGFNTSRNYFPDLSAGAPNYS